MYLELLCESTFIKMTQRRQKWRQSPGHIESNREHELPETVL